LRNLSLALYSLSGQLILEKTGVSDFPYMWDISQSSIAPGQFVLKIGNDSESFSQKVFLKK